VVVAGPDVLTVSGFDFDTGVAPFEVHLDVSGLPEGTSMLQVTGIRTSDGALIRPWIQFERVAPFALVAEALPGASSTFAPAVVGGTLANDSLGAPLAAAPVSDGTHELRSGFVEAAEGILRGTP
jgi:hypothetical protein